MSAFVYFQGVKWTYGWVQNRMVTLSPNDLSVVGIIWNGERLQWLLFVDAVEWACFVEIPGWLRGPENYMPVGSSQATNDLLSDGW